MIKINANQLRALAEHADGVRGTSLFLMLDNSANAAEVRLVTEDEKVADAKKPAPALTDTGPVELNTVHTSPFKQPDQLKLEYSGTTGTSVSVDLLNPAEALDSIYWSQSAVEKFLLPYYAGISGTEGVQKIHDAYTKQQVVAMAHRKPTVYTTYFAPPSEVALRPIDPLDPLTWIVVFHIDAMGNAKRTLLRDL